MLPFVECHHTTMMLFPEILEDTDEANEDDGKTDKNNGLRSKECLLTE